MLQGGRGDEVSPQALRRTNATLGAEISELGVEVARHLGHMVGTTPAITTRSYVSRDAAAHAGVDRALRVIQGGKAYTTTETDTPSCTAGADSSSEILRGKAR
ncbi:MAG TPA: hypothetical protein VIX73_01760 [Kofleriaceae bacterium]